MTSKELIKSFMKQAQWGQNANDGRPYKGGKWLTVKQINFLWNLCKKEDPKGIDFFNSFTWHVDGYEVRLGKTAPNGCRVMSFTNMNENKPEELTEEQKACIEEYNRTHSTKI